MNDAAPTALDILTDARAIIAKPEAWTQGSLARDAAGQPIDVEDKDAVSWCATGALTLATYRRAGPLKMLPLLQLARDQAGAILSTTVQALTLGHYTATTTYNDATNHGCILHTFDIAIADAKRAGTTPAA